MEINMSARWAVKRFWMRLAQPKLFAKLVPSMNPKSRKNACLSRSGGLLIRLALLNPAGVG
jgi:hypothetical protein